MEFSEVIKNRYSVRKFSDAEVPQELVNGILNVGRLALSAGNHQPTIVYVLGKESIEKLKMVPSAKTHPVLLGAQQALLVCYNKSVEMKRNRFDLKEGHSGVPGKPPYIAPYKGIYLSAPPFQLDWIYLKLQYHVSH